MNHERTRPRLPLAALALGALLCSSAAAQGRRVATARDADGRPLPARPAAPDLTPESIVGPEAGPLRFVATALRAARSQPGLSAREVAMAISRQGPGVVPPIREMLHRARVPALVEGQLEQILSAPQRQVLLDAFEALGRSAVLAEVQLALGPDEDLAARVVLIETLGAVGEPGDLEALQQLAQLPEEGAAAEGSVEEPGEVLEDAFRAALARLLRRDPGGAFPALGLAAREGPQELLPATILAVGDVGGDGALVWLEELVNFFPDRARLCASQVPRIGRSLSSVVNRQLASRLRWMLDPGRAGDCSAAMLALGELRDHEAIPAMTGFLEDGREGLARDALWSLRCATGQTFPADPKLWRTWYADELAWFTSEYAGARSRLTHGDPAHVADALRAICKRRIRRDELALDVLAVLRSSNPNLRSLACSALEELDEPLVVPALVQQLDDPEPACVQAAGRALVSITGAKLPFEAEAWAEFARPRDA